MQAVDIYRSSTCHPFYLCRRVGIDMQRHEIGGGLLLRFDSLLKEVLQVMESHDGSILSTILIFMIQASAPYWDGLSSRSEIKKFQWPYQYADYPDRKWNWTGSSRVYICGKCVMGILTDPVSAFSVRNGARSIHRSGARSRHSSIRITAR
jgi:hypothetical protein